MTWPLTAGAWALVAGGVFVVAFAAGTPMGVAAPPPPGNRLTARQPVSRGYAGDSLARETVARDLFRAERRPARVSYDPIKATAPPVPQVQKPVLVLAGIVWGKDPTALIEGLPGTDGSRVLRLGEVVAGFTVREIQRDRVIVTGLDTTWTLQVKEPWRQ